MLYEVASHALREPVTRQADVSLLRERLTDTPPQVEQGATTTPQNNPDPHSYRLVLRFALINLLAFGLLGAAYFHGLVEQAIAADKTHLVSVIFVVFAVGLYLCAAKGWQTSRDLNNVRRFDRNVPSYATPLLDRSAESRNNLVAALRLKMSNRVAVVRHVASSLVVLGLIGTVVGFIIALSGVEPDQALDVKSIAPMVSNLIAGMSTALYTTLVGAVLNIWLMVNHQLLCGGTVNLITACVEYAENHGRT